RLDVADDLGVGGDLHPIRRAGVAVHLAFDRDVLDFHAGGDHRRTLENEVVLLEGDGAFDLALDDEILLAVKLAFDTNRFSDQTWVPSAHVDPSGPLIFAREREMCQSKT